MPKFSKNPRFDRKTVLINIGIFIFVMLPMLVFTITTKVACENCDLCSNPAITSNQFFDAYDHLAVWFGERYFFLAGFILALVPTKYPWVLTLTTVVFPYALLGWFRCNYPEIALLPISPMIMMGTSYVMVYIAKRRFVGHSAAPHGSVSKLSDNS